MHLVCAQRAVGPIIATFMLAGCASGTTPINPTGRTETADSQAQLATAAQPLRRSGSYALFGHPVTTPSYMDPNASSKPLLFVSDIDSQTVNIYLQGGKNKLVGQITGLEYPYALAADSARNLYVPNEFTLGVQVYSPPYTGGPAYTLNEGDYAPSDVAVSPQGVVAIANYCTQPMCFPGSSNVVFFAAHSSTPCATIPSAQGINYLLLGSFDAKGNFFTNGFDSTKHTIIAETKGGCKAKKMSIISVGDNSGDMGGIHASKSGQISILNTEAPGSEPTVLYTYGESTKHDFGDPISTAVLQGTNRTNVVTDFALDASGRNVYVPDSTDGETNEYAYPAGGTPERTISLGSGHYVSGIAVTPPRTP